MNQITRRGFTLSAVGALAGAAVGRGSPSGFTSSGLPIGLMIAGPRFAEGKVLALARAFEEVTEWHKRKPPIAADTPVPAIAALSDDAK
jgi:aspartyl-tRNA(Asn)/glutamyl-tRNA(Gln) amidotransferase subunit A